MQTGILASPAKKDVWQRFAGENNACTWVQDTHSAKKFDVFIDLDFDNQPQHIGDYIGNSTTLFLLSAVNTTPELALSEYGFKYGGEKFFGINAIPTFLERKTLEISNPFGVDQNIGDQLPWWENLEWVKSRVGMVTPRIVFMIINEAYFTFQEGTASKEDIDQAMKLGTNYPKGPFEWCAEAGIDNVYSALRSIYEDTRDERYKISPALKSEWLLQGI
jgi:3-hydroxybutyryl-CoA dehydrogenase